MIIRRLIPGALAVVAVAAAVQWLASSPASGVAERLPGSDRSPGTEEQAVTAWDGKLTPGDGKAADLPGTWPRFRGPNLDNISSENVALAQKWGPEGPKKLWTIELGEGYAGAAVLAGRVYVLDYDREGESDVLSCLSLADGKEIWRYSYHVKVKRNHGMSRTVPTVTEKYVVSIGPKCHVVCLDAVKGDFRWKIDLVREYKTKVPPWYAGQCPLVDEDKAILALGGTALLIAVECETGKVLWKTPNPDGWQMTHTSIVPMEFKDKRMYVYCGSGGVVGVSAEDGRVLWKTTEWKVQIATVPSPIPAGEGRIFLTGGYNAGSLMLELKEEGEKIVPTVAFRLPAKVFDCEQQTPVLYNGCLYAVRSDRQLACLDLNGKLVWESGAAHRFGPRGLGPFMIANNVLYVLTDTGELAMVEPTPEGFNPLATAKILDGQEAWAPMAIAGGRLLLRDLTRMVCLDVKEP
jgi:outer membrane protein assembly factor BamB